ncbi:hypothetical protein ACRPOS_007220 [Bartonella heixiaziensis]|uniref:hypothetical protein n=1 Tax=Bartonella heixiaziensis TaxID=1461000 RepID=UPI0039089E83
MRGFLIKCAYRDEAYRRKLENEINRFNGDFEMMVQQIKRFETGFGMRRENALEEHTSVGF